MTVVYRVENEDGLGPYAANVSWLSAGDAPNQPLPENDGELEEMYPHERAAFASLDDLVAWFTPSPVTDRLRQEGFSVYAIDVPSTWLRYGERQVLIDYAEEDPDPRELVPWEEIKKLHREKIRR